MDIEPGIGLFYQFNGGYHPIPLDATTGIALRPGTGTGVITHGGKTWTFTIAGLAEAAAETSLPAGFPGVTITAFPADDLSALLAAVGSDGLILFQPGHYIGSYDFTVAAPT